MSDPVVQDLLRDCREFIASERECLLCSYCLTDGNGDPILATLDAEDAEHVAPFDALIARIDAAPCATP